MEASLTPNERSSVFEQHRALLFSIAYRMLGTRAEAEDMVQEAFLRWHRTAQDGVDSPKAWLSAAVTRLCIDQLRLARVRREHYVGPWLPEPLVSPDPPPEVDHTMLAESLSYAFLLLLERLQPVERAVFLLREVFEYEYPDIARVVGKSDTACRQIFKRARDRIAAGRPRLEADPGAQKRLMERFLTAAASGDTRALEAMFTEDIVFYSDGGGKTPAALRAVVGPDRTARMMAGLVRKASALEVGPAWVNGQPGIVGRVNGHVVNVLTVEVVDGRIRAIYLVVNPEKLSGVM